MAVLGCAGPTEDSLTTELHSCPILTADEWDEFDEHFDKRKVELGACGRPCGTPCQHEHACIRCPMLHVNPKMLGRLDELETDLRMAHLSVTSSGDRRERGPRPREG